MIWLIISSYPCEMLNTLSSLGVLKLLWLKNTFIWIYFNILSASSADFILSYSFSL